MSDNINDGGPAFPTSITATSVIRKSDKEDVVTNYGMDPGMTLRDYFAAAALTGIISSSYREDWSIHQIIDASLEAADEMLKARKAKP